MTIHTKPENFNPLLFEGEHLVRQYWEDSEIWFVASDVCRVLGLKNVSQALSRLDDDEKGITTNDTLGGEQNVSSVSEPGVYRLVFTSRKPVAERFKRWLAHEVIPSIRKTGSYCVSGNSNTEILTDVVEESEGVRLRMVTESRQTFGTQAAAQLWMRLNLPVVPAMLHDPLQLNLLDYKAVKSVEESSQ